MKITGKIVWILLAGIVIPVILTLKEDRNFLPEEKPNEWFFMQRAFPYDQVNHTAYLDALRQTQALKSALPASRTSGSWEFEGPVNTGGRLTDVEMHPEDINTLYIGAASGGVFKSTDQGLTWFPIFDEALSLSIGDIAIAPSEPDILYVGTGEANAGGGSLAYDGVGVYRSDDGGNNWQHTGLEESRNIGRMAVDPRDPDIVYVAAMGNLFANSSERGVYKTVNGGESWERVLFVSDSTGAIDVVIHPEDPDTVYAAMWERVRRPSRRSYGGATCGIYRSYDGGYTWQELTEGLPAAPTQKGRIGIDVSHSNPNILYAVYADKTGYFNGLYKSVDGGDTWTKTNDAGLSYSFASFGWWFGRLKVDPVNPDNVFLIGLDIYRTQNGGGTWTNQSGGDVHVDQHAVYIHPQDNDFVVLGNDGGLYISYNGGNTWTHNKTLPVTQFYTGALDFQFPERLYGGTQDNGTNRTMGGDTDDWERIFGGDGFYVLIDPVNNNYVYAESQYGNLGRSTNGGTSFSGATSGISSSDRFNWSCPVVFDPSDPSILYFGSNRLYRSTDRAVSWNAISGDLSAGPGTGNLAYHTLTTISVSAVNPEIIYTGSDDGRVHVSQDGGDNWTDISEGLPERWITRVAADPIEENIVYVTLSGYRWDEFQPHVFRSEDYGQNWADISGNLPEAPVNDIIINQPDNNILFVAADMGVFVSYDAGSEWMPLGEGLPPVVVNDLVLHKPTNKLVAATYGRSMYSYDLEQDPMTGWTSQQPSAYLQVYPNPFRKKVFISFSGQSFKGRIRIFDLSGKLIREIDVPGKRTVEWNGEDQEGNRVPDGVYIIRLSHSHSRNWIKLVKH